MSPLSGRGPDVSLARTYNSRSTTDGPFGLGWTFNMGIRLTEDARQCRLPRCGRNCTPFYKNADGTYPRPPGVYLDLSKDTNGFTLTDKNQDQALFRPHRQTNQNSRYQQQLAEPVIQRIESTDHHHRCQRTQHSIDLSLGRQDRHSQRPADRIWSYSYRRTCSQPSPTRKARDALRV